MVNKTHEFTTNYNTFLTTTKYMPPTMPYFNHNKIKHYKNVCIFHSISSSNNNILTLLWRCLSSVKYCFRATDTIPPIRASLICNYAFNRLAHINWIRCSTAIFIIHLIRASVGHLRLTDISLTNSTVRAWTSNYLLVQRWDVVINPCCTVCQPLSGSIISRRLRVHNPPRWG